MAGARPYDVVTFDCYGTLVDWEGGLATAIMRAAWADGVRLERGAIIRAYMAAEREVEAGGYRPYRDVLAESARGVAARLGWRLDPGRAVAVQGPGGAIEAMPFRLEHGDIDALGFRIGGMAYTPDVNAIPAESLHYLEGLDLWIVDALRYTRHPSHFSVEEALAWIARLKPRRAVLTNLHNDLDYERLKREVPAGVDVAFDGMRLEF